MSSHTCLNCGHPVNSNFCENCGQKAATHRLSFTHFIAHDFLHGVWHLEKGILYTLKEIVLRPGYAAKNYIEGKRIKYYNFFTLLLLLVGMALYAQHKLGTEELHFQIVDKNKIVHPYDMGTFIKLLLLSFIPLLAFWAKLFLKRLKYNYTEHMLTVTFMLQGILIISIFSTIIDATITSDYISYYNIDIALFFIYTFFTYYQFTNNRYTFPGYLWRSFCMIFLFVITWLILLLSIYWALGLRGIEIVYDLPKEA